ncbi:MAG: FHA domain-containing protein [Victivallales bacterium]|nr:FHA domain-containing protein [Victivallales bacterium]
MAICYVRFSISGQQAIECVLTDFPARIGRAEGCEVYVPHPSISGCHAQLVLDEDGCIVLQDLKSTNGIYFNYKRISEKVITGPTRVIMGKVDFDFALTEDDFAAMALPKIQSAPQETKRADVSSIVGNGASFPEKSPAATISRVAGSGHGGIVCPHCWHRFDVDEFLFIARHQSLIGDPVLGADAAQRFLPSRFTPEGNALDAAGMSCPDMACPRCHLRIPQAASEMPPLFLSIVGATASGKSYFLTSMTWELRNKLSQTFAISFTDTDAVNNQILNDFEETVFLHSDADELVSLRKTELQGDLYNQVLLDNMLINLPKPFIFTIMPSEHHPRYAEVCEKMSRALVLYDNAGEHFEPGMDSVDNPTTQHLLHADTICFLFDPTKDVRFRKYLNGIKDPQLDAHARVQRQEIILTEMINRIKKYSGLKATRKTAKTLLFIVAKFDVWRQMLKMDLPEEPWQWESELNTCAFDIDLVKNVSFQIRLMLQRICPEVVSIAESFTGDVVYLPNSALGHSPEINEETGMIGIRPADVSPWWVSVPMLYFFWESGFIPSIPEQHRVHHDCTPVDCKRSGDVFFVTLPGKRMPLQIPVSFAGYELQDLESGIWYKLPKQQ